MRFAKSLFIAIDRVFKLPQNPSILAKKLADVKCIRDIAYAEQYPEMTLDMYFVPKDQNKYPVIFEIHGGGFAAGDKKYRDCFCRYLAKNTGAAVLNVNYGVGQENACPLPMQHLSAAVNWVAHNADDYGLDISKFVVSGDSAGAFYACFLSVLQDSPQLQQLFECKLDARITAAVLNCGLYNLPAYLNKQNIVNKGVCLEFLGVPMEEAAQSKYFDGLNLIDFVGETFPPSYVIYAKQDVFTKGEGERLLAKLQQCNVPTESVHSKAFHNNHTYSLMWITKIARETNRRMLEFLNTHFAEGADEPAE